MSRLARLSWFVFAYVLLIVAPGAGSRGHAELASPTPSLGSTGMTGPCHIPSFSDPSNLCEVTENGGVPTNPTCGVILPDDLPNRFGEIRTEKEINGEGAVIRGSLGARDGGQEIGFEVEGQAERRLDLSSDPFCQEVVHHAESLGNYRARIAFTASFIGCPGQAHLATGSCHVKLDRETDLEGSEEATLDFMGSFHADHTPGGGVKVSSTFTTNGVEEETKVDHTPAGYAVSLFKPVLLGSRTMAFRSFAFIRAQVIAQPNSVQAALNPVQALNLKNLLARGEAIGSEFCSVDCKVTRGTDPTIEDLEEVIVVPPP